MQTFEQQQIVQLERRLATLASEFRACENDEQRRDVAQRYEAVFRQLEQSNSWCGEPYLDSQLPEEWMPAPSEKSASGQTSGVGVIRRKSEDDRPIVSPRDAMKNIERIYGSSQGDLLSDAKAFATKAGGIAQAHSLLDSLLHSQSTTELR